MIKLEKAVYVDHSFHQKTKATNFFIDIISKKYDINIIWDESWKGNDKNIIDQIKSAEHKTIFFFQTIPPAKHLRPLSYERIIWIPMYDQEVNRSLRFYLPYLKLNIKILAFSKKLYSRFKKIGFDVHLYQYFLEPMKKSRDFEKINIFFWQRHAEINWNIVKKLMEGNDINSVTIKNTPDPYQKIDMPSPDDINKYNIKIINRWLEKKDYFELMSRCNVFIAPRRYEGIGMGFLEAIASNMIVIAPDSPTMNEYIVNGQTGYLYNFNNPRAIKIDPTIIKNITEYSRAGYLRWSKNKYDILADIEKQSVRIHNSLRTICLTVYCLVYDSIRRLLRYWDKAIN